MTLVAGAAGRAGRAVFSSLASRGHGMVARVRDAVGTVPPDFSPTECFNQFRNSGYGFGWRGYAPSSQPKG